MAITHIYIYISTCFFVFMAEHDVVVSLKISMDNGCRREGIIVAACPRLIQEVPFFEGYIYIYICWKSPFLSTPSIGKRHVRACTNLLWFTRTVQFQQASIQLVLIHFGNVATGHTERALPLKEV